MAPSLPLPMGRASIQFAAGCPYHRTVEVEAVCPALRASGVPRAGTIAAACKNRRLVVCMSLTAAGSFRS